MKIPCQGTIVLMVFTLLLPLRLRALPDIDNPIKSSLTDNPFSYHANHQGFSNGQLVPLKISYETQWVEVRKNALGVRELDMTNMCHFNLVKSRLDKADISEEEFPYLYRNMELKQQQQQLAKLFPTPMQISSLSDEGQAQNGTHLLLAMNVAVSPEDNSPYLIIQAKNSLRGGTLTTYLDLLLEDESGKELAPMAHTLEFYEGENTITAVVVPLAKLKQGFPDLDMIHASSYVETQALDGTITSAIKHSQYPFSWEHIEQAFGHVLNDGTEGVNIAPVKGGQIPARALYHYRNEKPFDKNSDDVIRVCLNRSAADCDYRGEITPPPAERLTVNFPLRGQLVVPHKIIAIYPFESEVAGGRGGVDESTNIYFQEVNNGSSSHLVYKTRDHREKTFADYLSFTVDDTNRQSVISWDIPREQGVFTDAFELGYQQQAHWHITFVLKGYPYFKHSRGGGPVSFQISLSSQDLASGLVPVAPLLPKIEVSY